MSSKVIIAGSRDFSDYVLLMESCDKYLKNLVDIEIVSGRAKGADTLGEMYATERGYPIAYFPADWDGLGKKAGPIRNSLMAKYADYLICFWNGRSRGAYNMIATAKKEGLKIRIIKY